MKDWWLNLSYREKQTISIGAVLLFILFVYSLLWSPLHNKVVTMREQIQRNEKLLAWMQSADKQISLLEKKSQPTSKISAESILSTVQILINNSTIANQLEQLRQVDSDAVQLSFKQVDFDSLIVWMKEVTHLDNLTITQLTVKSAASPGMVSAEIIFKTS